MLEIEDYYGVDEVIDLEMWKREFNIPPREMAPAVLEAHGMRRLTAGLWSLMGPWADSLEHVNKASTFNAKAETLTERPAYRNALVKRRCVVPAEAFYEWVGPKKERQPLNIGRADGQALDGKAVQLLEASELTGPPDVDVHCCHNGFKPMDGEDSQPNARDPARRSG